MKLLKKLSSDTLASRLKELGYTNPQDIYKEKLYLINKVKPNSFITTIYLILTTCLLVYPRIIYQTLYDIGFYSWGFGINNISHNTILSAFIAVGVIFFIRYKKKTKLIRGGIANYCKSIGIDPSLVDHAKMIANTTFLLGEIQSSNEKTYTNTHVSVGKDAFGNLSSNSYNTHQTFNTNWVYDLENQKEVKYSSSGNSIARPGHVVGVAFYKGDPLYECNITTDEGYNFKIVSGKYLWLTAALYSLGFAFLGWAMIPVFAFIIIPFHIRSGSVGIYTKRSDGDFEENNRLQIILFLATSLITIIMYAALLGALISSTYTALIPIILVGTTLMYTSYIYMLKKMLSKYKAHLSACNKELLQRYQKVVEETPQAA